MTKKVKIKPINLLPKKNIVQPAIKKDNDTEVFSGVYMIHNKVNGRKYIGSTTDINRRIKTHKRELERGSHNNRFMQKDYDEAGPNNFDYVILEKDIKEDLLTAYEKYWIYKHNSIVMYLGYNFMFPTTNHKLFKQIYNLKETQYE